MRHDDPRPTRPMAAFVLLACLASAAPVGAALTVTARAVPPTGASVLLASPVPVAPVGGVYLVSHGAGSATGVGQTFRLEQPATLARLTVLARPLTDQVAGETVVWTLARFAGPEDVEPEEVLAVASGILPGTLATGELAYLVLDVDDLVLPAGEQLGFWIAFAGGGNVNNARMELLHTGVDSYAGGRPFLAEGSSYDPADADLVFFLEGETAAGDCLPLPAVEPLVSPELAGFRTWVRFGEEATTGTWWGAAEPLCTPETLCVSGALPGRTEVFVRIVGPKPNGYLWPTLMKLSTSRVEVWIEQVATGAVRCYTLPGAVPGSDELLGTFDRTGFEP